MPIAKIQTPDGRIAKIEVPQGATEEEIMSFVEGQTRGAPQQAPTSFGRTALEQSLQGATFGFADEVMDRIGAGIASFVTDESYKDLLKEARSTTQERLDRQFEERPALSLASQLAGGLLTGGAGASTKTGQAITSGIRSGGRFATTAKAAGAGAAAGGAFGAGTAQEGERLEGATTGVVLGGGLGILAPIAGNVIKKGASAAANSVTRRLGRSTGELQPVDKIAAKVAARLRKDFPDDKEYLRQLERYANTQGRSLIEEAGETTKNLAEGASLFPSAQKTASGFFDAKIGMAPDRIKGVLNNTVSPQVNYFDTLDDIIRVGRAKAAPLYNKAFAANQQVDSPVINKILATPEGKSALKNAVKNIQNEMSLVAKPDKQLTAIAKDLKVLNSGSVGKGLKLRTLDNVKRSFDQTANKALRAGDEAEFKRIVNLKNALVKELDDADASGFYAKAREASGDYLQSKKAMDDGLRFLRDDADIIARKFKDLSAPEKRAYKVGVLKSMRDKIDNTMDGRNVATLFKNETNRKKLQSILSKREYNKLLKEANEIDELYKLRNQMSGNSRTAIREIAAEEFTEAGVDIAQEVARRGVFNVAADKVVAAVGRKFSGLSDKAAGEVAEMLYETNPAKKAEIVKRLFNEYKASKGLRSTEAAQKLEAFFAFSEKVSNIRGKQLAVQAGAGGN